MIMGKNKINIKSKKKIVKKIEEQHFLALETW